jgi:hypothetical protein
MPPPAREVTARSPSAFIRVEVLGQALDGGTARAPYSEGGATQIFSSSAAVGICICCHDCWPKQDAAIGNASAHAQSILLHKKWRCRLQEHSRVQRDLSLIGPHGHAKQRALAAKVESVVGLIAVPQPGGRPGQNQ